MYYWENSGFVEKSSRNKSLDLEERTRKIRISICNELNMARLALIA